ncbi:hypothetical protein [Sphingomonas sp. NFR15]|uniref:hypothetical protein n=1 Tax=Sphingomonas sp. NFR15 TaxID=1566282 RepID=UPI0008801F9C|nr:hypothetical protein [Sphingomonas sp. NFR15]SDA14952.1 hypothetical protein SAMN03159340_00618 [Sphingomonas sp. NFR15]
MAGDPAIVKVTEAATALFREGMGINVFVDRSEDDPIREEERPAMAIRCVQIEFTPAMGQGEMLHECTFDFDFYEEDLTFGGISANLSRMIARGNALVAADRTLGGMLQQFELRTATAELDATPDLGCAILTAEISFLTPRDDFTTILGASGIF